MTRIATGPNGWAIAVQADEMSAVDFLRAMQGKPPVTAAERAEQRRKADEYLAKREEQHRREIEQIRDRLCALASPKLAAEFRAKWAAEDAEKAARQRRAA